MISIFQRYILLSLVMMSVACQRAAEERSSITISLPPSEKVGALSCTTCLKFLAVNISGDGINNTIYAKKEHGDFSEDGTEIAPEIEIEVPVGKQRLFQVVAAYSDADDDIEVKYGEASVDLSGSNNLISLTLDSLGEFEGAHIAGRFLTGANAGPTGVVNINLVPKDGQRAFTLFKTHIINGWFNFFASKNFEISYELEGGMKILSNIKLNDDFLPTQLIGNRHIARISRPEDYYRFYNAMWNQESEEDTELVVGFFFAPGYSDPNKIVCKSNATENLTNLSANSSGTPYMQYNPLDSASGDVRVYGGWTTSQNASCGSASVQQYNQDIIYLDSKQFNGYGNDTAKSLEGAFTYVEIATEIRKYSKVADTYSFSFLPNVFNTLYDGAKFYRTGVEPPDSDNISCNLNSLNMNGFAEVLISGSTVSGDVLSLTTSTSVNSGYGLICPTKLGLLQGHGGMYLGALGPTISPAMLTISDGPTYIFTSIATMTTSTHTFTVTNTGGSSASALGGTGLAAGFQFNGGTFPGIGGNCGAMLTSGASCTVEIQFAPVTVITYSSTFTIGYFDGVMAQSVSRTIQGAGL